MTRKFDAIVIGSGFGGAIVACRIAEKGMKVLVLERGRRWAPQDYPRKPGDAWLFSADQPVLQNGWLDLRFFKNMTIAQAAGVGGGSLAYSNVALEANPSLFTDGWPSEITYEELKSSYASVSRTMNLQTVPDGQLTQRFKLAREAAEKLGHRDRFSKAPLAVTFSPDWSYELDDPFNAKHSRTLTNEHGVQQGTCIHLGNCDIGCDVRAKNTLDLNYIPKAEQRGAEVRPLHIVRRIESRETTGYHVVFDRIEKGRLIRGEESAAHVFVAAGSLGSTELLLRCRDEHRTLPNLSRALGQRWSANANVLSMATYKDASRVQQTLGPSISSVTDFMDKSINGQRFVIEDDGFPNVLLNALRACIAAGRTDIGRSALGQLEKHVSADDRSRNLMLWLGAGMDAADGQLTLTRHLLSPWKRTLDLRWNPDRSRAVIEAILDVHKRMTEATGGSMNPNPGWSVFRSLMTLHPLGGCRMGDTSDTGVVDHLGRVFNYPNLYVVDGAILPAIGRNPSHTIAAMAERIAAHIN
jgi:cholesterol oxidase